MKTNIVLALGVLTLALGFIGCGAPAANTTNVTVKPTNTTAAANAANTTVANTATAPAAEGQVIRIEEAGIQVTVPKGFKFSKDGEDTIIQSEDEGVDIRFGVPADGDYDNAITNAAKEIDDYLTDVKEDTGKDTVRDINGMEGTSMSGTAKDGDGDTVVWNLTIIKAPKKPVLANIYAVQASLDKYAAGVKACLDSVKKL